MGQARSKSLRRGQEVRHVIFRRDEESERLLEGKERRRCKGCPCEEEAGQKAKKEEDEKEEPASEPEAVEEAPKKKRRRRKKKASQ